MGEQSAFSFGGIGLAVFLLVGLALVFFQPYRAFLFATFVSIAFSMSTITMTRLEPIGPYFNLYDACLLIALLAFVWDRKPAIVFPKLAVAMLAVLIIAFLKTFFTLGLTYDGLRALRWGITLPLEFILAANLVYGDKRIRSLLLTLLAAGIVAEVQHVFSVFILHTSGMDVEFLRTSKFMMASSELWLLAGFYNIAGNVPHPLVQFAIGSLFFIAMLSTQTRSVLLAFMMGLMVYYYWFLRGPNSFRWARFRGLFWVLLMGLPVIALVGLGDITKSYVHRLAETVEKPKVASDDPNLSRKNDIKVELNDWLNSNLIIGRGLNYQEIYRTTMGRGIKGIGPVAFGHVGMVTYLSQTGILGFLVYAFWLPLAILFRARRIIQTPGTNPVTLYLAALTGACFIYYPIMFVFSSGFLAMWIVPGLLAGAIWGARADEIDNSESPLSPLPSDNYQGSAYGNKPNWVK